MTQVDWKRPKEELPEDRQRILYLNPYKLSPVGEMIYFAEEEDWFKQTILLWAEELEKPEL